MLTRRLQILLDDKQYRRVELEAELRQTSVAAVIRAAIDKAFPTDLEARRLAAIDRILNAPPMPVPDDPEELRREIDTMYDEHRSDLL